MGSPSKSVSPATFDEQLAYDRAHGSSVDPRTGGTNYGINLGVPGGYEASIQREVARRRNLIANNGGFTQLPADTADLYVRDAATGAIRKARRGSTQGSLLGGFDPTAALGDSLIGGA